MSLTRTIMSLTRTGHIFMMMIDEAVPCAQIRSDQITHTRAGKSSAACAERRVLP